MLQLFPRQLLVAGMALFAANAVGVAPAGAADTAVNITATSSTNDGATTSRSVKVGLNKSLVIDLPRDARDILVSNPVIADAVIRTPRRIYVTGVAVGQSNVIVFDRAGQQIVALQLEVERDSSSLSTMLQRLLPDSDITVEIVSDNIVLSGSVKNASDARKAQDIANIFGNGGAQAPIGAPGAAPGGNVPPSSSVVNMLTIQGEDQVQVKVTVAEVNRNLVKQLGIDWNAASLDIAGLLISAATSLPFPVNGQPAPHITGSLTPPGASSGTIGATIRALQQTGMLRVLAEPSLTAISGESASFLAGGEFPVPVAAASGSPPTVEFKSFGVALAMTPVVLSDGRISLRVKTEVSQLSTENTVGGIPGLSVRRAETTLELPSGGSMVLGGLLQDTVRQSISALPGLGTLPVLGPLFRSRDFQRDETELVIIATPYLVKPVARTALATPDQGFATPGDSQTNLFGSLNRIYGSGDAVAGKKYHGRVGYIFE